MSEVKRVAVFGPESTGKTTLARTLAAHFGEPWSEEFAREFWDAHDGKIGPEDLDLIGRGQVANEESAAARAQRLVFCDTDLLTCVLWNDLLFPSACPDWVRRAADLRAKQFALYLFCETDVAFVPDPQRCFPDEEGRERARMLWRSALEDRGLRCIEIRGDWPKREAAAITAVKTLLQ